MPQLIILSGLIVVILTYVWFSRRTGNFVNVLTPFLLLELPAYYVLELVYLHFYQRSGSDYAYFYCYLTFTCGFVATAIGYLGMTGRRISLVLKPPVIKAAGVPFLCLAVATALYAPILIAHRDLITSPRQIYSVTRSGFGINFFLSSFAIYVGYILFLFSQKRTKTQHVVFFTVAGIELLLHGSKGEVLTLVLIALYYEIFVRQTYFDFKKLMFFAIVVSVGVSTLFYVTSVGVSVADLVTSLAEYSDYTRNSMLVIDDPALQLQHGALTVGGTVYSLVPRALFPDKPTNFGALWLAQQYFPSRFASGTGAPAFGLGVPYADFGDFAIVYWVATSLLSGMAMRLLTTKLRVAPDAGTFALLLVFLNIQLIPAGASIPLLFYYFCALIIRMLAGPVAAPARSSSDTSYIRKPAELSTTAN